MTGANVANVKSADAGLVIADRLTTLLQRWNFMPDGLSGVGYGSEDLDRLIQGTLPQRKVIDVSPRQPSPDDIGRLFENSMKLF
jgi:hydroxyacid-oxoacid transhydrogenase